MTTATIKHQRSVVDVEELQKKADLFDELVGVIEDKYLGSLMEETEGEKNIPLSKAKKMLRG
jgi:hypothetical protein